MTEGRESQGLRNAVYGMLAGLVANLLAGLYYAGQFTARLEHLEQQSLVFQVAIDRVNDAREKTDIHMTQMDDRQIEQTQKIEQILRIVQDLESSTNDGASPPTFTPPAQSGHRGP